MKNMYIHHESCHVGLLKFIGCKHMKPEVVGPGRTSKDHRNEVSQRMAKVNIRLIYTWK